MRRMILLLIVNWTLLTCLPLGRLATAYATIHYVSHSGNNTPPYLTWQTAADSIQWAINVSQFGDTIYVANGVYKEQVVMIPGLSLIGAGMDSWVIDTRGLTSPWPFISVEIKDSCLLKGFKIIVTDILTDQWGIGDRGTTGSIVTQNWVKSSFYGIEVNNLDTSIHSNLFAYKNIIDAVAGVDIFNSDAIIRGNTINTAQNPQGGYSAGVRIEAYYLNFYPTIDSNYIYVTEWYGIRKSYGTRPTIRNNTILLHGADAEGMELYDSDSTFVYNNLIISHGSQNGIYNAGIQYIRIYNNYLTGSYNGNILTVGDGDVAENNVITGGSSAAVVGGGNVVFKYNNVWNNAVNYSGLTPDSTNLSVDPMIMNDDTTRGKLDFHLQKYSPLIDRGDPTIKDKDSSRSDIGLYGGPWGEAYNYIDLPPHAPVNFTAVDSNGIFLSWNRNTEADTSHYNVYRDTTSNFTIDSTKLIGSPTDTFFTDAVRQGVNKIVYKVTAVDKQGNESEPSDEQEIILTGINHKPIIVKYYRLYQNYPNPFNPTTKIGYRLKESGYVKLYVYDIKGALVETLVNGYQSAGYHEVEFNGKVGSRQSSVGKLQPAIIDALATGVYIYQIMVRNDRGIPVFSDVKKMILLK